MTLVLDVHRCGRPATPPPCCLLTHCTARSAARGTTEAHHSAACLPAPPRLHDRSEVRRSYSLSSSPAQLPRLSITVKRLPGGMASTHLHSLEVGATVHVLPPAGDFTVQPLPSGGGVHLFFAAGSGIAPILPMLRAALARGEPAALLHCSRWRGEVIFGAQLAQLERDQQAGAGHLLAVQHCLSKEQPQVQVPAQDSSAAEPGKDEGMGKAQAAAVVVSLAADARRPAAAQPEWYGRLTERRVTAFLRDVLRRVVPGQQGSGGAADAVSVRCYMCGPVGWMETIRGALKAAGEGMPLACRLRQAHHPQTPCPKHPCLERAASLFAACPTATTPCCVAVLQACPLRASMPKTLRPTAPRWRLITRLLGWRPCRTACRSRRPPAASAWCGGRGCMQAPAGPPPLVPTADGRVTTLPLPLPRRRSRWRHTSRCCLLC